MFSRHSSKSPENGIEQVLARLALNLSRERGKHCRKMEDQLDSQIAKDKRFLIENGYDPSLILTPL